MLKKLIRRLRKWFKEFKLIEESYEERYVIMKYGLGIVKYQDKDGEIKNYLAQKEENGFILHGKSNMCQVLFNWRKFGEKEGVMEWMPIHEVTEKLNSKYNKEIISSFHEGLEEHEYKIIMQELQTIL